MVKSTKPRRKAKSAKPYEGFPLTPHPSGRWCKKIRGKLHYFGKVDNPEAALERFNREWPYLSDGRTPPPVDTGEGCTLRLLCNAFLTSKTDKLNAGELSRRSFLDYHATCSRLLSAFGKDRRVDDLRPDDFQSLRATMAKTCGMVRLRNEINRCRIIFKFAFDQRMIDRQLHFEQSFDRPSLAALRIARSASGPKTFTAEEIHRIIGAADAQLTAMTLLGINCGLGNSDCARLKQSAIDFGKGWLDYPRPMTGIHRRCPLWRETIAALRKAIASRPAAKNKADDGLVFLTDRGVRWVRVQQRRDAQLTSDGNADPTATIALDALTQQFAKVMKSLGISGRRGFYNLRHSFETIAGGSKDQVAVDAVMGHVDPSMAATYRHAIEDERLEAVAAHVHGWLFPASRSVSVRRKK